MNPEQNNPLTNPGGSATGSLGDPMGGGGLSMSDSLASAQDNLTSAGMAANTSSGVMGLDQIASSDPTAMMTPPVEEPLVPAAPVPGSIGSVTSVPLNPFDSNAAGSTYDPTAMGDASLSAQPAMPQASAPFNPFAQPSQDSTLAQPMSTQPVDPAMMDAAQPSVQPSGAQSAPATQPIQSATPNFAPAQSTTPKTHGSLKTMLNPLSIASLVLTVIFLISTIVLAVLLVDAINNPKVVYVPQISDEESNQTLTMLSCSYTADGNVRDTTFSFTGDVLNAISLSYHQNFENEEIANNMLGEVINGFSGILSENFTTNANVDGITVNYEADSNNNALTQLDAVRFIYGVEDESLSTSKEDIKAYLEGTGAVCIAE